MLRREDTGHDGRLDKARAAARPLVAIADS